MSARLAGTNLNISKDLVHGGARVEMAPEPDQCRRAPPASVSRNDGHHHIHGQIGISR